MQTIFAIIVVEHVHTCSVNLAVYNNFIAVIECINVTFFSFKKTIYMLLSLSYASARAWMT